MGAPENPAAFPSVCLSDPGHPSSVPGMTLRDWFAGQALAGIGTWRPTIGGNPPNSAAQAREWQAEWAYLMANAMLATRTVQP